MEAKEDPKIASIGRPKVGAVVNDRYELTEQIGVGGFATVYRAMDRFIEREVAVKILNLAVLSLPEDTVDTVLKRFRREAKLAARIRHPCVVQIFDFGLLEDGAEPYMVMELLEGHDLEEELNKNGLMEPERALPLFIECLEALGEAHDLGIVHKDLKPSNLFLTGDRKRRENLRIVDFGIAHIGEDSGSRLTQTGYMLGTPQYMAPEYLHDQTISPPLDVYQMGLILVEVLTGRPVVDNQNPWTCALMHVSRDLIVPTSLMNSPLGPIIDRALAVDPNDRYPDGRAFAEALTTLDASSLPKIDATTQFRKISAPDSDGIAPKVQTGDGVPAVTGENPAANQERISEVFTQTLQKHASLSQISKAEAARRQARGRVTAELEEAALKGIPKKEEEKKSGLWIALALLGLVALVVGFVLANTFSGEEEARDELGMNAQARVEIPLIENRALAQEAEPAPVVEEPVPTALAESIDVRILSTPSGASVWLGEEELGMTPLLIKLPVEEGESLEFFLRREGFKQASLRLEPHENAEATVELESLTPAVVEEPTPTPAVVRPTTTRPAQAPQTPPKTPPKTPEVEAKPPAPAMILAP